MSDAPRIFSGDYYERMRLLESASWWNAGMRDIAEVLLHAARLPDCGRMIDVGCGSGQTMAWFSGKFPRWTVSGVDVSPDGVSAAKSAGLDACIGNATALPFATESADLGITLDVLQHLPLDGGDAAALSELNRVLCLGGYLFVRTNSQAFPHTVDDAANDFRKYTTSLLRQRVTASGFEIIRLSRVNSLLGLAEIARELRATEREGPGYHGILAVPPHKREIAFGAKRAVLRSEGELIKRGLRLPFGRSIVALCRKQRRI